MRVYTRLLLALFVVMSSYVYAQKDSLNQVDNSGLKQGLWKKYYSNGNLKFVGFFKDNYPVGEFTYYYNNGRIRTILIHKNKGQKAFAKIFYQDGTNIKAKGNYINKKKDSIWCYYNIEGRLLKEESFKNNKLHGKVKVYYDNGVVFEELNYVDSVLHGPWRQYYSNGNPKFEANYINGLVQGETRVYFMNGQLYKYGKYINSLKDGKWIEYNEKGKRIKEEVYVKGRIQLTPEEEKRRCRELDSLMNIKLPESVVQPNLEEGKDNPENYY